MTSVMFYGKAQSRTSFTRKSASVGIVAFALAAFAAIFPVYAGVTIYQNVFVGDAGTELLLRELDVCNTFRLPCLRPMGIPSLTFSVACDFSGDKKTIVLTALENEWPVVELDTPAPELNKVNWDGRAA